jgi:hypothetical protein
MSASATPRSRLMREVTRKGANVAEGDMAIRSLGSGFSLQEVKRDTQVKKRNSCDECDLR